MYVLVLYNYMKKLFNTIIPYLYKNKILEVFIPMFPFLSLTESQGTENIALARIPYSV